jgi:DNA-binding CsgD family transcriptional regulator
MTFVHENLTPTEIRVASLIRDGKTIKEIAKIFGVSESFVNSHRQHIRNKLGIANQKINLKVSLVSLS